MTEETKVQLLSERLFALETLVVDLCKQLPTEVSKEGFATYETVTCDLVKKYVD